MPAPSEQLDPFTLRRLLDYIEKHRKQNGTLPTLQDLSQAGFSKPQIARACKENAVEELYVTLTSGTVVKGYRGKAR